MESGIQLKSNYLHIVFKLFGHYSYNQSAKPQNQAKNGQI